MKEIDIIKHAQTYMDMLSKGINPITKEKYSEKSDINNERLLKCFDFVSGILLKVIAEEEKNSSEENNAKTESVADSTKDTKNTTENIKKTKSPDKSEAESGFVNSLVSDDVNGQDVIDVLISKGVLNHGFPKKR